MGWVNPGAVLLAGLVLMLVSAGVEDIRTREIANWKNAAIALAAPAWWWASGVEPWPGMAIQLGLATLVFALFCGAFAIGMMGGGDVKMIGALALWLPLQPLLAMLIVMSIAGGVLTLVMMIIHRARGAEGAIEVPYGVAIAFAALLTFRQPLFNHFGS